MIQLLAKILDAYGGMNLWPEYSRVEATIVTGGGLFPRKGIPQDRRPIKEMLMVSIDFSEVQFKYRNGKFPLWGVLCQQNHLS